MSVVHDLDDALCEYSCCSGDVAKCPDYAASKCGGEFGRVSLYNMMAAPVTIGLQAFLTDKDGENVIIQYGMRRLLVTGHLTSHPVQSSTTTRLPPWSLRRRPLQQPLLMGPTLQPQP